MIDYASKATLGDYPETTLRIKILKNKDAEFVYTSKKGDNSAIRNVVICPEELEELQRFMEVISIFNF